MTTIQFPTEFSELLKLLKDHDVRYLVVGGYAVGYHGYPRSTGDLDIWVERSETNAHNIVAALEEFGFDIPALKTDLFTKDHSLVRMGIPPIRVKILTTISGVEFEECFQSHIEGKLGSTSAHIIALPCLKKNKKAAGRHKDLSDLENLQ